MYKTNTHAFGFTNRPASKIPFFTRALFYGALMAWSSGCGASNATGGSAATPAAADSGGAGSIDGGGQADAVSGLDSTASLPDGAADGSESSDSLAQDASGVPEDSAGQQDATSDSAAPEDATLLGCPKACTSDQVCKDGVCVDVIAACGGPCAVGTWCDDTANGGKGACVTSGCTVPTSWTHPTHKLSEFQVAQSSQGCDLTGDGKPNNVLGNILKLYPAINTELKSSIEDGLFNLLLEADGFNDKGVEFKIAGLLATLDSSNASCSMTDPAANCKFKIDNDNYLGGPSNTICKPRALFEPAKVASGELTAGDPNANQKVTITLPTSPALDVTLSQVSLHGYPTMKNDKWAMTKSGKLCGVITQKDFQTAIDSVPEESWQSISLTKEQVKLIIGATLKPDIDTNDDGFPDAISVTMLFESVPATIIGLTF